MIRIRPAHWIVPVFALLLLTATAGAADDEVATCTDPVIASTVEVGEALAPTLTQHGGEIDGPSAQADCTAQCWDGSTVECSGSSCTAQDSDCGAGERGYCTSGPFQKDCPPCEPTPCSATANCDTGGTASCSGYNVCIALDGCYAYCEDESGSGFYVWCYGESPSTCPLP